MIARKYSRSFTFVFPVLMFVLFGALFRNSRALAPLSYFGGLAASAVVNAAIIVLVASGRHRRVGRPGPGRRAPLLPLGRPRCLRPICRGPKTSVPCRIRLIE
jgi:hypothetical protein